MAKEIERKWLLKQLPKSDRSIVRTEEILQGYLVAGDDSEVRIRRAGKKNTLTVKSGSGLTRDETEISISAADFDRLWPSTEGQRIFKSRLKVFHKSATLEIDSYSGDLRGLYVVEAEFKSENDAMNFVPPAWVGREVTGDKAYGNRNLATKGTPKLR